MHGVLDKIPLKSFNLNIYGSSLVAHNLKTLSRDQSLDLIVKNVYPILCESVDLRDYMSVWEFKSDVIPKFHYFVGKHAYYL
jgi:hypothetical protein